MANSKKTQEVLKQEASRPDARKPIDDRRGSGRQLEESLRRDAVNAVKKSRQSPKGDAPKKNPNEKKEKKFQNPFAPSPTRPGAKGKGAG